jgi:hypothetical protein
MQQNNVYQTQRLMESGVDFNLVYSEKQSVIRDMTGFDFNLQSIVAFLKAQTDNFQKQIPLALDIDKNIKAIYDKWASKGEPTETPTETPTSSSKKQDLADRLELLNEMLSEATNKSKKSDLKDRIELIEEMVADLG